MTEHAIPEASLTRLRAALQQFQDLGQVIVEAMGLADRNVRLELERGMVVEVESEQPTATNGQVKVEEEAHAG